MQELDPQKFYLTTSPLSRQEEIEAFIALRAGDTSQVDRITKANIRFVIEIAKPYVRSDVSIRDLVASGCLGLLEGIKRFDHTKGFKLISFAVHWIRQSILLDFPHLKQRSPVRYPVNVHQLHERIQHTRPQLAQTLQREPHLEEIFDEIAHTHPKLASEGMKERAIQTRYEPLSLDEPLYEDDHATYHDRLSNGEDILTQLEADDLHKLIAQLVDTLSEREQKIIRSYFGFDGQARTLEVIGGEMGITRERVRQIKEKAVDKLKRRAATGALAEMAV